jgi:peroxiredoxin
MQRSTDYFWPSWKGLGPRIVALLALCLMGIGQALAEVKVGAHAPAFKARTLEGVEIDSQQLKGRVVVVNFWATWCAPCMAEMPALEQYLKAHRAQGLEVIAISMDATRDLEKVKARARQLDLSVAHRDQADLKAFGRIWRLPSTFVIDRQGLLVKNGHEGAPEVNRDLLEAVVTPLLQAR